MIGATALWELVRAETDRLCSWPGCPADQDAHGYCRKHWLRIERGWEVGTETPWERLVAAALRFAEAETDRQYDSASEALKRAAEAYRRACHKPGRAA